MRRLLLPDRWEQIVKLAEEHGSVEVEQLAQDLNISKATVRRDLLRIEQRGLINRVRGGATPSPQAQVDRTLAESRQVNPLEKEMIGVAAAGLVRSGETLMIDGGYTTYQFARNLDVGNINVATNSFDVANAVMNRDNTTLIFIGGELYRVSGTTIGHMTEYEIKQLSADKAILGANAFSPSKGLTSHNPHASQIKKAMIQSAHQVIVLADYTKLGKIAVYTIAPTSAITTLVTDDKADKDIIAEFRAAGVEVLIASAS